MATFRTTRTIQGPSEATLSAAVEHFAKHGYALRHKSVARARLTYGGSVFAADFARLDHALELTVRDGALEFVFSSGWSLSLTDEDESALAARVDDAMHAADNAPTVRAAPPPSPSTGTHVVEREVLVTRCRYCQKITPVDLEACSRCGAAKFV